MTESAGWWIFPAIYGVGLTCLIGGMWLLSTGLGVTFQDVITTERAYLGALITLSGVIIILAGLKEATVAAREDREWWFKDG